MRMDVGILADFFFQNEAAFFLFNKSRRDLTRHSQFPIFNSQFCSRQMASHKPFRYVAPRARS